MTLHQCLNDRSVPLQQRMRLAWAELRLKPEYDRMSEDRCSAKCWLLYRLLDSDYAEEERKARATEVLAAPATYEAHDGLAWRWKISLATAEMYWHGMHGSILAAIDKADWIVAQCQADIAQWPPMLLNGLRAAAVSAAIRYQFLAFYEARFMCRRALDLHKQGTMACDYTKWPLRLVEMRDDLHPLWHLLALSKRLELCDYQQHDWLPMVPPRSANGHPYYELMTKLEAPQLA
jgi:hypothetical protein